MPENRKPRNAHAGQADAKRGENLKQDSTATPPAESTPAPALAIEIPADLGTVICKLATVVDLDPGDVVARIIAGRLGSRQGLEKFLHELEETPTYGKLWPELVHQDFSIGEVWVASARLALDTAKLGFAEHEAATAARGDGADGEVAL